MIGLASPEFLSCLAIAAAPVLIHIAHRRNFRRVRWGAMRFLLDLLQAQRRRLALEQWLLLTVRSLALLLLALAWCRPYVAPERERELANKRSGAVAAVLLVDDSLSSGAGRGERAIDQMKRLADAYLGTLRKGDEISLLTMSRLDAASADPIFDRDAAHELIAAIQPTAVSSDVPALLKAGIEQLAHHVNPVTELVLISDGSRDGWPAGNDARWQELRRSLAVPGNGRVGARVIILSPTSLRTGGNIAITGIHLNHGLISVGRPVTITVSLACSGKVPLANALVRIAIDGRAVGEQHVASGGDATQELRFTHSFSETGSHLIEAWIEGARDQLPRDDQRTYAVEVEAAVPVLLVEGTSGEGLRGSLGFVAAALDPADNGQDLFAVTRISVASFRGEHLDRYRAVILGDVSALDAQTITALEAFTSAGGGILVVPGPATDLVMADRYWWRGGTGFLPMSLGGLVASDEALFPATVQLDHPALASFTESLEAWGEQPIGHYVALTGSAQEEGVEQLVGLSNGAPLIVECARGHGRVAMLATSLDGSWCDLPRTVAFVPLMRGLIGHLASVAVPTRNVVSGERIVWLLPPAGVGTGSSLFGPDGARLPLIDGDWEGHRALFSQPIIRPGGYTLRVPGEPTVRFAVAAEARESRLETVSDADQTDALQDYVEARFSDSASMVATFSDGTASTVELWRFLIIGCVLLLIGETLLARRQATVIA